MDIILLNLYPYVMSLHLRSDKSRCSGARERVQNNIPRLSKQLDEPFRQGSRECGTVVPIAALCRKVQHVSRISHLPSNPIGNFFSETALDVGFVTFHVNSA